VPTGDRRLLAVILPHATFGLVIHQDVCVLAPPIAKWCQGRDVESLVAYWRGRGGRVMWVVDP
jgi:hypothetical protein